MYTHTHKHTHICVRVCVCVSNEELLIEGCSFLFYPVISSQWMLWMVLVQCSQTAHVVCSCCSFRPLARVLAVSLKKLSPSCHMRCHFTWTSRMENNDKITCDKAWTLSVHQPLVSSLLLSGNILPEVCHNPCPMRWVWNLMDAQQDLLLFRWDAVFMADFSKQTLMLL